MPEGKHKCPKCGSTETIQVGKYRFMCQNCYTVFDKEGARKKPEPRPPRLKKCPYCMEFKPEEGFKDGICADCVEKYAETARQSETHARKKQDKKDDVMEIASAVAMPDAYLISKAHEESAIGSGRRGSPSSGKFPKWVIILIAIVFGVPVLFWIIRVIVAVAISIANT
ncbi:hypothetical protein JXM67_14955 [candidate division WOR-3 bacterium]|nr:hypothetical protein [candidate division WOR-3 bacterium]